MDISWELPFEPNGELVSCTIRESGASSSNIVLGVAPGNVLPPTSHSLSNRLPGVTYTFIVFCSNDLDGATMTGSGATMVGGECVTCECECVTCECECVMYGAYHIDLSTLTILSLIYLHFLDCF